MKKNFQPLDQLLSSASKAPGGNTPDHAPFGLATRVLADLRSDDCDLRLMRWRQMSLTLGSLSCLLVGIAHFSFSAPQPSLLPVPQLELNAPAK